MISSIYAEYRAMTTLKAEYEALSVSYDKEGNPKEELRNGFFNIFNQKTCNYITYNQINSFESQHLLRG